MLTTLLRSRLFAGCMHLVLWILLGMALLSLGTRPPQFVEAAVSAPPGASPVPILEITNLFSSTLWPRSLASTNTPNPFYTRHFIPPVVPPPPPPTTRKIQVTFHGCYQTGTNPPRAFLTVGDKTVTGPVSTTVAPGWSIAELSQAAVVLTNATAQTNRIAFNQTLPIEVPAP